MMLSNHPKLPVELLDTILRTVIAESLHIGCFSRQSCPWEENAVLTLSTVSRLFREITMTIAARTLGVAVSTPDTNIWPEIISSLKYMFHTAQIFRKVTVAGAGASAIPDAYHCHLLKVYTLLLSIRDLWDTLDATERLSPVISRRLIYLKDVDDALSHVMDFCEDVLSSTSAVLLKRSVTEFRLLSLCAREKAEACMKLGTLLDQWKVDVESPLELAAEITKAVDSLEAADDVFMEISRGNTIGLSRNPPELAEVLDIIARASEFCDIPGLASRVSRIDEKWLQLAIEESQRLLEIQISQPSATQQQLANQDSHQPVEIPSHVGG
ncbi:hypothetical protein C8J56DRAFT_950082 [Mycena floridula]|nr:hypothetical protein C8J56DRAFT_950082 [Mycena floridula]